MWMWHAPLQTLSALRKTGAKCRRANFFFVRQTTHRFTHFPEDDFREILTQNVNRRRHKTFGTEFQHFSEKGSFFPKKLILGALGVHLRSCPLGVSNLSIAPSRRAGMLVLRVTFCTTYTVFEMVHNHP